MSIDPNNPFGAVSPFSGPLPAPLTPSVVPVPDAFEDPTAAPWVDIDAIPTVESFTPEGEYIPDMALVQDMAPEVEELSLPQAAPDSDFPPRHWVTEELQADVEDDRLAAEFDPEMIPDAVSGGEHGSAFVPNDRETFDGQVDSAGLADSSELSLQAPDSFEDITAPQSIEDRYDDYSGMSSAELARTYAEEDAEQGQFFAEEEAGILSDDATAHDFAEKRYADARAEAAAETDNLRKDIDTLSAETVDRDRWMDSRSPMQKAAIVIGALAGGFIKASGGDGDSVLDFVNASIDADVADQKHAFGMRKDGLTQRQNMLGGLRQATQDEFRAAEAHRIVRLKQAYQMLDVEKRKYDPNGTAARRVVEGQQQIAADIAQRDAGLEKQSFDRSMAIGDQDIKRQAEMRQQRKTDLEIRKGEWDLKKAQRVRRGARKYTAGQIRAMYPGIKLPEGMPDMSLKELDGFIGRTGKVQKLGPDNGDALDNELKQANIAGIKNRTEKTDFDLTQARESLTVPEMKSSDGSVYVARNATVGEEVALQRGKIDKATRLVDKILALRHKHGAELFGSEEGKLMDSLLTQLMFEEKTLKKTGTLDDGSVEAMRKEFTGGTKDASATLRSFDRALKGYREESVLGFNEFAQSMAKKPEIYSDYTPPEMDYQVARRGDKSTRIEGIAQGIPESLVGSARAKAVEKSKVFSDFVVDNDEPKIHDLEHMAFELNRNVIGGGYSLEEAIQVGDKLAMKLAEADYRNLANPVSGKRVDKEQEATVKRLLLQGDYEGRDKDVQRMLFKFNGSGTSPK